MKNYGLTYLSNNKRIYSGCIQLMTSAMTFLPFVQQWLQQILSRISGSHLQLQIPQWCHLGFGLGEAPSTYDL